VEAVVEDALAVLVGQAGDDPALDGSAADGLPAALVEPLVRLPRGRERVGVGERSG
jgi:hypothetical protein